MVSAMIVDLKNQPVEVDLRGLYFEKGVLKRVVIAVKGDHNDIVDVSDANEVWVTF